MILLPALLALSLSDPRLNVDVRPETIAATICRPHWTKTVRPPSSYIAHLALPPCPAGRMCVVDHIISLELGGAPRDLRNLQVQTVEDAKAKDVQEHFLHRLTCSGRMPLRQAQELIAAWRP